MPMCSFVSLALLLQKLPLNKAPGPDCISAEHLLYADESLRFFLSELFNMCIVHGYIPNSCLNTTIVPICSDGFMHRPIRPWPRAPRFWGPRAILSYDESILTKKLRNCAEARGVASVNAKHAVHALLSVNKT